MMAMRLPIIQTGEARRRLRGVNSSGDENEVIP
jgi:hypothetical protein